MALPVRRGELVLYLVLELLYVGKCMAHKSVSTSSKPVLRSGQSILRALLYMPVPVTTFAWKYGKRSGIPGTWYDVGLV